MNRNTPRYFVQITFLALAVSLIAALSSSQASVGRKPNVIILFIDDLGYGDIGCFGNPSIPTPHIDTLAEQGARLTMHYITNPPCSPSRCAVMTGMYAQRFHKFGMARGLPIPADHPTMGEFMRDAGYVTGQVGKWDLGSEGQGPHERGFMEVARWPLGTLRKDSYLCEKPDGSIVYRTDQDGDYMVEFVERNKDKPFFLYFSPFAIHGSFDGVPQAYKDRIREDVTSDALRDYGGAVVAVDEAIGKLLAVLKKHQLDEHTLIFFTGDNGPGKGGSSAPYAGGKSGGGGTQKEGWVHTPGIATWPGTIPAGTVYEGLSCTLDYYATAAAVAGVKAPERCDGKDLLPYLTGERKGDAHEFLYWYNADPKDASFHRLSAVRWKDWRIVQNQKTKAWQLFDIRQDPREMNDLAEGHADVVKAMAAKHETFVSTLPSLDSIPGRIRIWAKPPVGWGWIIGDGKGE